MLFTKRLREGVRRGTITCSVRIWMRPHVAVGKRYRMEEGEIEVDSILPISYADITPAIARASGFKGVVDLIQVTRKRLGLEDMQFRLGTRDPESDKYVGHPDNWALAEKAIAHFEQAFVIGREIKDERIMRAARAAIEQLRTPRDDGTNL